MGLTYTDIDIGADRALTHLVKVRFLIDSGAEYSVIPRVTLEELGVVPYRNIEIILADGSSLKREAGDVYFQFLGVKAPSPVIFGEPQDEPLLGAVTLENLGFMLDPLQRRIIKRKALRG